MWRAAILVGMVVALWAAWHAYLFWFRPIDQPTSQLRHLEEHMRAAGISGHLYPVRHGHSHSRVQAVAAYQIEGYPLPVVFTASPTQVAAAAQLGTRAGIPADLQSVRNGNLVLDFPAWGDDTLPMAQRVRKAFEAFPAEP